MKNEWENSAPRYLLRDRNSICGDRFRDRVKSPGIEEVLTEPERKIPVGVNHWY